MPDTVIKVENLSKRYRLGTIGGATLREDVSRWWAKLRFKPDLSGKKRIIAWISAGFFQ